MKYFIENEGQLVNLGEEECFADSTVRRGDEYGYVWHERTRLYWHGRKLYEVNELSKEQTLPFWHIFRRRLFGMPRPSQQLLPPFSVRCNERQIGRLGFILREMKLPIDEIEHILVSWKSFTL